MRFAVFCLLVLLCFELTSVCDGRRGRGGRRGGGRGGGRGGTSGLVKKVRKLEDEVSKLTTDTENLQTSLKTIKECADELKTSFGNLLVILGKDPCDKPCTREYRPVCGTDGKTYGNMCVFEIAMCRDQGLQLAHNGPCCEIKICSAIYQPVCGSDGNTYGNVCQFEVAQCKDNTLKIVHNGECCPTICTLDYKPVCGSDGKTYGNMCMLHGAMCQNPGLEFVKDEEC